MIQSYLKMSSILLLLDSIYLFISKKYFQNQIFIVQHSSPFINLKYVFLCYLSLTLGLFFFIIRQNKKPFDAFLLGIFVYSVYELTNASIFTKWNLFTVFLDTIWGGILFYLTTFFTYFFV